MFTDPYEFNERRNAAWQRATAIRARLDAPGYEPTAADERALRQALDEVERLDAQMRQDVRDGMRDGTWRAIGRPAAEARDEYTEAFRAWVVDGERRMSDRQRETLRTGFSAFDAETRALGEATGAAGGYLVPTELRNQIASKLASYSGILESGRATMVITKDGRPLNVPANDDTSNYGDVVAENADVGAITDPVFSQVALPVRTYTSKPLRVSWQFLADSGVDGIEGWLGNMLAARIGRRLGQHLVNGDPAATPAQPEGYLKNVTTGITTTSPTAVTYDELVDMTMSVDPAYHGNAAWLIGTSFRGAVAKLKDTAGNPIWSDPREGYPATLLGYPVVLDANLPAVAALAKPAVFGDMSAYAIRRAEFFMLRLTERYAEFGQVGFLLFARYGAVPLVSGAYKALVMHA
jgi:HK97 family phage major capsid protein